MKHNSKRVLERIVKNWQYDSKMDVKMQTILNKRINLKNFEHNPNSLKKDTKSMVSM